MGDDGSRSEQHKSRHEQSAAVHSQRAAGEGGKGRTTLLDRNLCA